MLKQSSLGLSHPMIRLYSVSEIIQFGAKLTVPITKLLKLLVL
jgi:hypothetical protein